MPFTRERGFEGISSSSQMKVRTGGVVFQAGYFVRRLIEVAITGLLKLPDATTDIGATGGEKFESRSLLDREKPFYDFANKLAETRFRYSKRKREVGLLYESM